MSKATFKMSIKGNFYTNLTLLMILIVGFLMPQCAKIVAPTGGPKDTLPPVLLHASPADSTLQFDQQKITFEFDEFIQLKDLRKQMIISPTPKKKPEIKSKLRMLTIDWINKDSLTPNTTYIVNLGDAVTDLNEGNVFKDFKYVFSTGDYLDSLEIRGKLIDARTGLPDSTALVMLYTNLKDSVVTLEKPLYYTRCKGDGSFTFENLPADTFKVFALKDGNGDLKYNGGDEPIAFLKNAIPLDSSISGILLSLFNENEPKEKEEKKEEKKKKGDLTYTTSLSSRLQDLKKPLVFTFNHSLKLLNKEAFTLQEDTTHKEIPFKLVQDTLFKEEIKVNIDSALNRDTTITRDTIIKKVNIEYDWKEDMQYRLLIDSAFATDDRDSVYAKTDTLTFKTKLKSDYGELILTFDTSAISKNKDREPETTISQPAQDSLIQDSSLWASESTNRLSIPSDSLQIAQDSLAIDSLPSFAEKDSSTSEKTSYQLIVELYKDDKMIYSAPLKGKTWRKAYLDPGKYQIRVVKDLNKNGKWDRGCYYCKEKRPPEQVYSFPDSYEVRANWENENPDLKIIFEEGSFE